MNILLFSILSLLLLYLYIGNRELKNELILIKKSVEDIANTVNRIESRTVTNKEVLADDIFRNSESEYEFHNEKTEVLVEPVDNGDSFTLEVDGAMVEFEPVSENDLFDSNME